MNSTSRLLSSESLLCFVIITYCPLHPSFNHRWSSFSGLRFQTVEHSALAERHVGAVTDCFEGNASTHRSVVLFSQIPCNACAVTSHFRHYNGILLTYLLTYLLLEQRTLAQSTYSRRSGERSRCTAEDRGPLPRISNWLDRQPSERPEHSSIAPSCSWWCADREGPTSQPNVRSGSRRWRHAGRCRRRGLAVGSRRTRHSAPAAAGSRPRGEDATTSARLSRCPSPQLVPHALQPPCKTSIKQSVIFLEWPM